MLKNIPFEKRHVLTKQDSIKGASTKSANKKIASRLRQLRKKGLTDKRAKLLYDAMTDSDLSSLDILMYLETLKSMAKDFSEKEAVVRLQLKWHVAQHGQKHQIEEAVSPMPTKIEFITEYPSDAKTEKDSKKEEENASEIQKDKRPGLRDLP